MFRTTYAVWAGRFQPFHLGHFRTIRRMARLGRPLTIAVIATSAASGRGAYGRRAAEAGAACRNPLTVWERMEMIRLALSAEPLPVELRVIGVPRPDVDWHLTASFYPSARVIYLTDRDEFESVKLRHYTSLGEDVVVVGVKDLPTVSASEVRARIRAGAEWQSMLHPATVDYFKEIHGPERLTGTNRSPGIE
ncbi:hypothetical protein [Streptomyces sp. NPDC052015]|uniref:hypothetical protein n=1 Tax=Streptomyces sp. NPDC052015 TaxID=3154755 RepID=UPI00343D1698